MVTEELGRGEREKTDADAGGLVVVREREEAAAEFSTERV